jgi:ATP-binding cassette subfamily B protein
MFRLTGLLVIVLSLVVWIRPALMGFALDAFVADLPVSEMKGVKKWFGSLTAGAFETRGEGLLFMLLAVVVLLVIEAVLQFYQTYLANWVAQSVTLDLRSRLYRHVLDFKLRYFDRTPVGAFVTRLVSDIDGIAQIFSDGLLNVVGDLLKLTVVLAVMFYTDWRLSLIVLAPVPVLLLATRVFQRAIRKAFTDVRNEVNKMNVFVQEHVSGMSIVQAFGREKREQERFEAINKEHRDANIRSIWAFSIFFPLVELLSASSVALLLWWGMRDAMGGAVTLGTLLEFILYVFMLYRPIRMLADRFNVLQMGVVNAQRVFDVLDTRESIPDNGTLMKPEVEGRITFEKVWFAYEDEDWVLKDVSFSVQPGQTVAFVGATGAGKSSVINLVGRFYEYQKGLVAIDGIDLRSYALENIRQHVAIVLQDVFLFSDTIHHNVTLHNESISREAVVEAAKQIGAHEFICALPNGYDFNVGERGGALSVGQRQLLAFMRAYVYNPSILILDEATSSVDTESEELIQKAIEKLTEGRTSIVIAHRLSTIQRADNIMVMDKGCIVQQGTHNHLLEHEGPYRKLYDLQFA